MATLKTFWSELRRRRVIRAALVYAVVAWLLIQIAESTFEPLQLPEWSVTLVIVLLVMGFPVALILAWAFDLTPSGLQPDTPPQDQSHGSAAAVTASPSPGATSRQPSIAVLPFADMSPQRDHSYFCEGVAEEIINLLACVPDLLVASRMSSFRFAGQSGDIQDIGRQLNVTTVLEGSVRKADDQLRITAQLIDVENGYHIWSERFDREMCDVFAIQDEIAHSIVDAMELQLTPDGRTGTSRPQADIAAYEFYLRGRQLFHRHGHKHYTLAAEMFERAIEIDPDYALAWAGLADTNAFRYLYMEAKSEFLDASTNASQKAITLAPDLAEAHASRGLALLLCKCYPEAEQEFEAAIRLNPRQFEPYYFYARASVHQGKMDNAEKYFLKASEVRPEDYQSPLLLSRIYRGQGRTAEATVVSKTGLKAAENSLRYYPDDVRAMYLMTGPLFDMGEVARANELAERALAIDPHDGIVLYNVACFYAQSGELEKALDCLLSAGMPAMANKAWVEHDEDLAPLRGHPRFDALLKTLS